MSKRIEMNCRQTSEVGFVVEEDFAPSHSGDNRLVCSPLRLPRVLLLRDHSRETLASLQTEHSHVWVRLLILARLKQTTFYD